MKVIYFLHAKLEKRVNIDNILREPFSSDTKRKLWNIAQHIDLHRQQQQSF